MSKCLSVPIPTLLPQQQAAKTTMVSEVTGGGETLGGQGGGGFLPLFHLGLFNVTLAIVANTKLTLVSTEIIIIFTLI